MRNTVEAIRDGELNLMKKMSKGKKGKDASKTPFDPKKPKSVTLYVATAFSEWQDACVQAVRCICGGYRQGWRCQVREILTQRGLIKDSGRYHSCSCSSRPHMFWCNDTN